MAYALLLPKVQTVVGRARRVGTGDIAVRRITGTVGGADTVAILRGRIQPTVAISCGPGDCRADLRPGSGIIRRALDLEAALVGGIVRPAQVDRQAGGRSGR